MRVKFKSQYPSFFSKIQFANNQYIFIKTLFKGLVKGFSLRVGSEELCTMHTSNNFQNKYD